jgi:DNA-directed RNA polymerase specialized sigma24 family protein
MTTQNQENKYPNADFKIYLDHLKGIWLARDPLMHDILYRQYIIDLDSKKYGWILDDKMNVYNKVQYLIMTYQKELKNLELVELDSISRASSLLQISSDNDFTDLYQKSLYSFSEETYPILLTKIRSLQKRYHEAISRLNRQNRSHLYYEINGSSTSLSISPNDDCDDILQDAHLMMLQKIHQHGFIYPETESPKTPFNALFRLMAKRLWLMLIRKRQLDDKYNKKTKGEFDNNIEVLKDEEKNINVEALHLLMKEHKEINILVKITTIDDEADELKRVNSWSEHTKDEYIWTMRKKLLEELDYKPSFWGKISESYFKSNGQAVIRKRKEAGIKKLKEVFTNYAFNL